MSSTLFTHALVLTGDPGRPVIDNGAVAVNETMISAVGPTWELRGTNVDRIIDLDGDILMPGFINTHTHLAGTITRGLVEDVTTGEYLERIWPIEALGIANGWFHAGERVAVAEHLMAGITTANDMFFDPSSAMRNAAEMGLRLLAGTVYLDFPGPDGLSPAARMDELGGLLDEYRDHPLIQVTVAPHAGYTVSPDHLQSIWQRAVADDLIFHIHAAESKEEDTTIRDVYDRRPVEHLGAVGVLAERTVLAHAIRLDDTDLDLVADTGAAVAHCPISNLKTVSGICRVDEMLRRGIRVGLGTDGGTASNDYDMFSVMRAAATLGKYTTQRPERFTAREVVAMATIGGAEVLGIADRVGTLTEGKQADLISVDMSTPHNVPMYDPFTTLVYQAGRSDVRLTMVEGEIVMDDRRLTRVDVGEIVSEAATAGRQITSELEGRRGTHR